MNLRDVRVLVKVVGRLRRQISVKLEHLIVFLNNADGQTNAGVECIVHGTVQSRSIFAQQLMEHI